MENNIYLVDVSLTFNLTLRDFDSTLFAFFKKQSLKYFRENLS